MGRARAREPRNCAAKSPPVSEHWRAARRPTARGPRGPACPLTARFRRRPPPRPAAAPSLVPPPPRNRRGPAHGAWGRARFRNTFYRRPFSPLRRTDKPPPRLLAPFAPIATHLPACAEPSLKPSQIRAGPLHAPRPPRGASLGLRSRAALGRAHARAPLIRPSAWGAAPLIPECGPLWLHASAFAGPRFRAAPAQGAFGARAWMESTPRRAACLAPLANPALLPTGHAAAAAPRPRGAAAAPLCRRPAAPFGVAGMPSRDGCPGRSRTGITELHTAPGRHRCAAMTRAARGARDRRRPRGRRGRGVPAAASKTGAPRPRARAARRGPGPLWWRRCCRRKALLRARPAACPSKRGPSPTRPAPRPFARHQPPRPRLESQHCVGRGAAPAARFRSLRLEQLPCSAAHFRELPCVSPASTVHSLGARMWYMPVRRATAASRRSCFDGKACNDDDGFVRARGARRACGRADRRRLARPACHDESRACVIEIP